MIDYEYADLFYGSHAKTWIFTCTDPDVQLFFSNDDIVGESISLRRGMCETDFFAYGTYSSACLKVKVLRTDERFKGKRFLVDVVLDNHTETPLTVGTFTCHSDRLSSDRKSRELVMYDDLYKLNELDVADWYNHYWDEHETVLLGEFRMDFFYYCLHMDYELADSQGTGLANDLLPIKKAANFRTLSAGTVLKSILQFNCVNGRMTNTNKFRWVRIKEYDMHMAPPDPHWDVIPDIVLDSSKFYVCNYEEYQVLYADGMRIIIDPDNVIIPVIPTHDLPAVDNVLDISYDNMFFRNLESSELTDALSNNYSKVNRRISFTPAQIQLRGNLCYEPGDVVEVDIDGKTIYTVIIEQTITGVQGLTMTLSCQGDERFSNPLSVESASYDDYAGAENQGGGGTSVVANPTDDATDDLIKLKVGDTTYNIASASPVYITQNAISREIGQTELTVVRTQFNTKHGDCAVFNGQARIDSSDNSILTVRYYINNEVEDYYGEQTLISSGKTMLPLYKNFPALNANTSYMLTVTMEVTQGLVDLQSLALHGSIICYVLGDNSGIITSSDIAVSHTAYLGENTIWAAFVENDVLKVKYAEDTSNPVWTNYAIPRIVKPSVISMAFNSDIAGGDGYWEFITTERPFIAYIQHGAVYLLNLMDNSVIMLVSENVTDISLVRAPKFIQAKTDYGFVLFFVQENQLCYMQLIGNTWYDAEIIPLDLPSGTQIDSIEGFVTWDFRVGVLITTSSGDMYQLVSYFEGLSNLMNEHIEVGVSASVVLNEISYYSTQEIEHVEVGLSAIVQLIYGHSAVPVLAQNVEDEEENWGTTVEVIFDYPVHSDGLTAAMFTLVDSRGNNYICDSFNISGGGTGRKLTLVFDDFNLAGLATNVTLSYTKPTSGGLMSPAVQTDSFSETFVPVNLDPPQVDPPTFLSATNNAAGTQITVYFTEEITNADVSGMAGNFTIGLHEYNYVPNGTLQDTTRTVASVEPSGGTIIDLSTATMTDTDYSGGAITLEVDTSG